MQHAGNRAHRAGANIGRGAGYGSGDADPAEKGRRDIGKALSHQLHVRPMLASSHAIGDLGR